MRVYFLAGLGVRVLFSGPYPDKWPRTISRPVQSQDDRSCSIPIEQRRWTTNRCIRVSPAYHLWSARFTLFAPIRRDLGNGCLVRQMLHHVIHIMLFWMHFPRYLDNLIVKIVVMTFEVYIVCFIPHEDTPTIQIDTVTHLQEILRWV